LQRMDCCECLPIVAKFNFILFLSFGISARRVKTFLVGDEKSHTPFPGYRKYNFNRLHPECYCLFHYFTMSISIWDYLAPNETDDWELEEAKEETEVTFFNDLEELRKITVLLGQPISRPRFGTPKYGGAVTTTPWHLVHENRHFIW
jgi:hypothetical protein